MRFDKERRNSILRERAADYVQVALECITSEYPVMPYFIATGPGPYPTHRELHPAFYGSFDWHSCVEMHWVIIRLQRLFPEEAASDAARATLNELLTPEHIAKEMEFFRDPNHKTLERPYGWGWFLTLSHELETWEEPDAKRWAEALRPLAELLSGNIAAWLPVMTYPQRTGLHPNTAFGMSRSYDFAQLQRGRGNSSLVDAIHEAAARWFKEDTDYPGHYEPSGADFLSAGLCEAELMSRILDRATFSDWLGRFLPGIAASEPVQLFEPVIVSDITDGQIAHLHGLNLSRAWAFTALAERLPDADPRIEPLLAAAERHAEAALPHVSGSDYTVEHWLAAYATLLLS